jgi:hypothetical protein
MMHFSPQQDMSDSVELLTLSNESVAGGMESGSWTASPKLSSLIVSLAVAALGLSLTIAAVISLIAWAVG